MAPALSDKRSERYHYLRDLGFSSADAKLWSHRSGERQIDEIERRSPDNRNDDEERIILSRSDRFDQWVEWSNPFKEGFPDDRLQEIIDLNERDGRAAFDKYGFRAYYAYYVLGEEPDDAEDYASGYEEE